MWLQIYSVSGPLAKFSTESKFQYWAGTRATFEILASTVLACLPLLDSADFASGVNWFILKIIFPKIVYYAVTFSNYYNRLPAIPQCLVQFLAIFKFRRERLQKFSAIKSFYVRCVTNVTHNPNWVSAHPGRKPGYLQSLPHPHGSRRYG